MSFGPFAPKRKPNDRPCLRCGYSLRHNIDATRCTECGLPVRLTLNPDNSIEVSNPAWLWWNAMGALVLAIASLTLLIAAGFVAASPLTGYSRLFWEIWVQVVFARHLLQWVFVAFALLLSGGLIATTFDEGRCDPRIRSIRQFAFWVAIVWSAIGVWFLAASALHVRPAPPLALAHFVALPTAAVAGWLGIELARRIPSRSLATLFLFTEYAIALLALFLALNFRTFDYWLVVIYDPWSKETFFWPTLTLTYALLSTIAYARLWWIYRTAIPHARAAWEADA